MAYQPKHMRVDTNEYLEDSVFQSVKDDPRTFTEEELMIMDAKAMGDAANKRVGVAREIGVNTYDVAGATVEDEISDEELEAQVSRSATLMSVLVIISRITGFMRTWGQAFALGNGMISSCYTVANYLPNMLYELVLGGMIATSFLPVYMSIKRRVGKDGANRYTSNLLSLVLIIMGAVCLVGFVFAGQVIWTQSFSATSEFDFDLTVYLFRFFVIEVVLYALSSVFSGVLNAERDYLWSNAAPIFNNLVLIAGFFLYYFIAPSNPALGTFILAVANPLGVAVQVLLQVPSLKRHGIVLRPLVDIHDPAIRETVSIGVPTVVVILAATISGSIQVSCQLSVTPAGASIANYAHLWSTLPYAVFAIPVTVAMFTELSDRISKDDIDGFKRGVTMGIGKISFFLVPFMLYLIVFSFPLVMLMAVGRFTIDEVGITAEYLAFSAAYLPFYGIYTYLQKACSSLRKMHAFAIATVVANLAQIAICLTLTRTFGLNLVALTQPVVYGVTDVIALVFIRKYVGSLGLGSALASVVRSFLLGAAGAAAGWAVLWALQAYLAPLGTGGVLQAFAYTVAGGIPALLVTYGLALAFHVPEASALESLLGRFLPKRS